jgi:hypothetical protein
LISAVNGFRDDGSRAKPTDGKRGGARIGEVQKWGFGPYFVDSVVCVHKERPRERCGELGVNAREARDATFVRVLGIFNGRASSPPLIDVSSRGKRAR